MSFPSPIGGGDGVVKDRVGCSEAAVSRKNAQKFACTCLEHGNGDGSDGETECASDGSWDGGGTSVCLDGWGWTGGGAVGWGLDLTVANLRDWSAGWGLDLAVTDLCHWRAGWCLDLSVTDLGHWGASWCLDLAIADLSNWSSAGGCLNLAVGDLEYVSMRTTGQVKGLA